MYVHGLELWCKCLSSQWTVFSVTRRSQEWTRSWPQTGIVNFSKKRNDDKWCALENVSAGANIFIHEKCRKDYTWSRSIEQQKCKVEEDAAEPPCIPTNPNLVKQRFRSNSMGLKGICEWPCANWHEHTTSSAVCFKNDFLQQYKRLFSSLWLPKSWNILKRRLCLQRWVFQ